MQSNHCMLSRLFWVIGVTYSASVLGGRGSDRILAAFLYEATHYRRRTHQSHIAHSGVVLKPFSIATEGKCAICFSFNT